LDFSSALTNQRVAMSTMDTIKHKSAQSAITVSDP
jgi:hypothetical protein